MEEKEEVVELMLVVYAGYGANLRWSLFIAVSRTCLSSRPERTASSSIAVSERNESSLPVVPAAASVTAAAAVAVTGMPVCTVGRSETVLWDTTGRAGVEETGSV